MPETKTIQTQCVIAGGGPAGIMLGFLLARAGIDVTILEKWPDFFRDFRGDTIHPSTMDVLDELGLLEEFLKLPHDETTELAGHIGGERIVIADFSHLKTKAKFIGFMPQWDFLNFIASHGRQYPKFHLMMETEATDLIRESGKAVGVKAKSKTEQFEIRADLVVGADGRHSILRQLSGLKVNEVGVPIDVLWFRLSRQPSDQKQTFGRVDQGRMMVLIERGTYWQVAYVIRKDGFELIKQDGLENFRRHIGDLETFLAPRTGELKTWDDVKFLSVTIDRLEQWYADGLLFIGDAAHAMSPIGGVGINCAIQDAVGASNILIPAFKRGRVTLAALKAVQDRRLLPTRFIQRLQIIVQNQVIDRVLHSHDHPHAPWPFKFLNKFSYLRRFPAWAVGVGIRPEHVKK